MRNLFKVYMWPVWIFALGTQEKNFKANPILGSKLLNKLGLHILRVLLAHSAAHVRWFLLRRHMPKPFRKAFHNQGYVAIEDFISPEEVAKIRADVFAYSGEVRQMTQGDTATQRFLLDTSTLDKAPSIKAITENKDFRNFLSYTAGKATLPMLYIQRIRNGFRAEKADPQKNMHSDTFHPTMKAWLFLEDVTEEKGPFTYVAGSNRLTKKRLLWEYRKSTGAAQMNDKYSEKGSLRAGPEDLKEMGLPEPKGITAKAGTLVIANTNGFHGRGQAEAGASRMEIWAYSRHNPFNIYPGLNLAFVPSVKHKIMTAFLRKKDRKAAAKGSKASWHLISADKMLK